MAVTTWNTIRSTAIAQVRAITPDNVQSVPFRHERSEKQFREWANSAVTGVSRQFAIDNLFQYEEAEGSDGNTEWEAMHCEVVVAYENYVLGKGSKDNMELRIEEDRQSIDAVLGIHGRGNFTDACLRRPLFDIERDEKVTFLVIEYEVNFWRNI